MPRSKTRSRLHSSTIGTLAMGILLALHSIAGAADDPTASGADFFETNIRPLLVEHCYSCHSTEGERVRGGLLLDSRAGWLKGGDIGPAVTPGDPADSLLISAVSHEDELLKMPPKGKLDDRQIELLTQWVEMGAPGPHEVAEPLVSAGADGAPDPRDAGNLWAFQAPVDPPLPEVEDRSWPRNGIDRFLLAALEAKGITPAPPADRRTWLRRATFDLTGLPPTPDEVDAFLADETPEAYARVVDRLLSSPQYGERWGRHWLDLARYADSNGLDENVAHGNAWRYRDYVVAAFNDDTPYDQFVLEQLAGDVLPPTDSTAEHHRRLIATGFLALGPKVLAEVDERKMEMDIVDEQIDTTGRTFLGLTLGCARCHDHKFDPIATTDYYALAGVFKSTRTMETFTKVARWHENSLANEADLARKAEHDQAVAAARASIDALAKELESRPGGAETGDTSAIQAELERLKSDLAALEAAAPELPTAMGATEGTVADTSVHIRGSHLTLGDPAPRGVPVIFRSPPPPSFPGDASGRLELARWLASPDHPLTARVMVNRIWRWHFGVGLVGTTDNFGALGAAPTHPELLDWLALRFVEGGWSIKAMHRMIMHSTAYRMSVDGDPTALEADPENRLLSRMSVRRLEAEAIRDALLAVGGALDRRMGGSLLTVANRGYFFDHTSKDATDYDTPRRSIYLPVVRNHLYDVFELFDATDASVPNGDRATTTVAPQALFLMNGDLALNAARDLAGRLHDRADLDAAGRVRLLYELAYGRPSSAAEIERALAFLELFQQRLGDTDPAACDDDTRSAAWQGLCQAILASNEFVTVR